MDNTVEQFPVFEPDQRVRLKGDYRRRGRVVRHLCSEHGSCCWLVMFDGQNVPDPVWAGHLEMEPAK